MARLLANRAAWTLLVLWFVLTATFAVAYWVPADPARAMVGPYADAATVQRVRAQMSLDRSFFRQYVRHVTRIARGDLGTSFRTRQPVAALLRARAWPTVQLAFAAVALQLLLGLPLGVLAAIRRGRASDAAVQGLALLGQSAPTFVLGPFLMVLFAHRLQLFPISGYGAPGLDLVWHLLMPALTLAAAGIASTARVVRGDLIEALGEDYVRTARAKGLPGRTVVLKHALRNALVPVVTLSGLDLGVLLGGAAVTEYVFAWPGLGREAVMSVFSMDLPVILGMVLVAAIAIAAANLLADLVAAWLSPPSRER